MTVAQLILDLRRKDILLRAEGDRLIVSAAKGALTPELAAEVSRRKPEILAYFAQLPRVPEGAGISALPRDRPLPLGLVQRRMWIHSVMEPDTVLYNLVAAWRLEGPLDPEALRAAVHALVDRHELLRVRIDATGEEPTQTPLPAPAVALPIVELRELDDARREAELDRLLAAARDAAFDFATGPLFRASLIRLGEQSHVFCFVSHHVIWDGVSSEIFERELAELYTARCEGRAAALPALPIQYADYAVWHRAWLNGGEIDRQLGFWRGHLAGELPVLELPIDKPRPRDFSYRGDWVELPLDKATMQALAAVGREQNATTFMVLLAAWYAFLHRHTGQEDIVVGVPIQARPRPETAGVIGAFVNTLALRARIAPDASFRDFLVEIRNLCLGAYEHKDTPVEMLVDELVKERTRSRTPLFQAMFSHVAARPRAASFGPLAAQAIHVNPASAATDLTLEIVESAEGARAVLNYSTDLFTQATVRALGARFEVLLAGIAAKPSASLAELPLLTPAERDDVLEVWNRTEAAFERGALAHHAFEAHARKTPDRLALEQGDTRLTYGELDRRAELLAARLRGRGVGPDVVVGIFLERTPDLVVAALAVWKAGGAYLPLDPAFPADRLAYMVKDAQAPLVVTHSSRADDLPQEGASFLHIDADEPATAAPAAAAPGDPESLAYLIYTSGSTGRPKGVQLRQRAVVNFLTSMAATPGLGAEDRLLAVTTLSFDISVLELFLPLSVGGTIVLATQEEVSEGELLAARLDSARITVMQATPATWRMMLDAGWTGRPGLKVLCGGEALPAPLAKELLARTAELWNMYGPTETTVWSTCLRVTDPERITIGRPIANTRIYILDQRLRPVPPGVAGDLFIAGDGLARGYHGRPELTAQAFVADPFATAPDARMYRTGDRARFLADGQIEYLQRRDTQVKVRGFRIELGEIETVLASNPHVRQAVANVLPDPQGGGGRIIAYLVYHKGQEQTGSDMRRFLRNRLPDYMLPHLFVELEAIPLTDNGKVNRRALPSPLGKERNPEEDFIAPRTPAEQAIADVWKELLKVNRVSVRDNFFELGGHSLLSTQMVVRVHKVIGRRLDLRAVIFETLEQLAAERAAGPRA